MEFNYKYAGSSAVTNDSRSTDMSFVPDTKREPTFFRGELEKSLSFREAISALHDVVVSDLRFKPKDREEYKAWAEEQIQKEVIAIMGGTAKKGVKDQIEKIQAELGALNARSQKVMGPFYNARRRYYDYLYKKDRDAWFVLDPVITVHPDEIFFECFSQDESTYGKLGASYEVFKNIGEFECGTTNIDYSDALYKEFQKIRTYKTTKFEVDPSGFDVQTTAEEDYKELKIDLPDTWVRGFLQVSSAMTLPATSFRLHPMDVYNFCFILRRHKEIKGPRAMRFLLKPGEPIRVYFEPWNYEIVCKRSIYEGEREEEIRVWGRRRILILERLIQVAKSFTVHLLGTGLPSFYVADLGHMSFTLGLSGWTANDWSRSGNFDLMAPRAEVDKDTKQKVFDGLKKTWLSKPDELAKNLKLDRSVVLGALGAWTQAGRAIYDLNKGVYRVRELSQDALPLKQLRFSNEREASANRFLERGKAKLKKTDEVREESGGVGVSLSGKVDGKEVSLMVDSDQRLKEAQCECYFYKQNKLFKGPCEHILALRMEFSRRKK